MKARFPSTKMSAKHVEMRSQCFEGVSKLSAQHPVLVQQTWLSVKKTERNRNRERRLSRRLFKFSRLTSCSPTATRSAEKRTMAGFAITIMCYNTTKIIQESVSMAIRVNEEMLKNLYEYSDIIHPWPVALYCYHLRQCIAIFPTQGILQQT